MHSEKNIRLMENSNTYLLSDYNGNDWNFKGNANCTCTYSEAVLLTEKKQVDFNSQNSSSANTKFAKFSNFSIDVDKTELNMQTESISNRTSTRTIPNILKNKSKVLGTLQSIPKENETATVDIKNTEKVTQLPLNFPSTLDAYKCRTKKASNRRKQKHNFIDISQEVPNWNVYSIVDDNKVLPIKLEPTRKRKNLQHSKKLNIKHEILTPKVKREIDSLSPTWSDTSINSVSEFNITPEEMESRNLEDMIDFSSNEIFNKFHYELCDFNNLDCFRGCVMDSDQIDSLSTSYNTEIQEKEYDINGNKVDSLESTYLSSTHSEQSIDVLADLSLTTSKLLPDKESCFLSDVYCDDYLVDCAPNWALINETTDKVIVETLDGNTIGLDGNIDYNISHSYSDLYAINSDKMYSTDNLLIDNARDLCNESNSGSITTDTQITLDSTSENIQLPLKELTGFYNETECKKKTRKESTSTEKQKRRRKTRKTNNIEKQVENTSHTDASYTLENGSQDKSTKTFQCLLCPLTFSSSRTMALHQAGAHGGTYVILCESCGRLFNRKHNFTRHFINCGRFKELYKCDMCMKKYRHKSSLIHHLKISHYVHYTNSQTKFTCNVCKKIYRKFGAFEKHIRLHKDTW